MTQPNRIDIDLESAVYRLATQAALQIVSRDNDSAVFERLHDFVQDRGAVGILLKAYAEGKSIEEVSLFYWGTRLERSASRFEDLITTALISTLSSIIAGIIVEIWKGEFGPLKRLLTIEDKERLREWSRKEPGFRRDFDALLPVYNKKVLGGGVQYSNAAKQLYEALISGASFKDFSTSNEGDVSKTPVLNFLQFAYEVGRGVVETELRRAQITAPPPFRLNAKGEALSDYLAFGETISLCDTEDLGLGPSWRERLSEQISLRRLYPDSWPSGVGSYGRSPKILILNDRIFDMIRRSDASSLLRQCAGIISSDAGMTSHTALLCRGLSIGAIRYKLSEEEFNAARFAYFRCGELDLYGKSPGFTSDDFNFLISAMARLKGH